MASERNLRPPSRLQYEPVVRRALEEDLAWGDVTSGAVIPADATASASLVARQEGVAAGIRVAALAFELVDPELRITPVVDDGDRVSPADELLAVSGRAVSILAAERVALNFVQRLSGIATLTARYVAAAEGTGARIVDTRKTTPGLRVLEKYAVRCGGGQNHRAGLGDAVLIKDNHRAVISGSGISLADAVRSARRRIPHVTLLEVELDSLADLEEVLAAGADAILLDNMTPARLVEAVEKNAGRGILEASGGVTLDTVRAIAETGVDLVSVGALTHSAPAFDAAVDFKS